MSNNKNHKCQCEHENVSYCKTCKVCHCEDCNQEWRSSPYTTWAYQYPYWSNTGAVGIGGINGNTIVGGTTPQVTLTTGATTCDHK